MTRAAAPRTRSTLARPAGAPVVLNTDCASAEGLVAFWPLQTTTIDGYRNVTSPAHFQLTAVSASTMVVQHGPDGAWAFSNTANAARYFEVDGLPVSAPPFTVAAWFHAISVSSDQALWSMGNAAGTHYFALYAGLTNEAVSAVANAGAGAVSASSSVGMVVSTWHHACAVFTSSTARAAYLDGGKEGTNTTSCAPSGIDRCRLGVVEATASFHALRGRLAHVCVWNVAKTATDIQRFYDPATRWELYYTLGQRRYFFPAAALSGVATPLAGARGALRQSLIAGGV